MEEGTLSPQTAPEPKKDNTLLIVIVVVVVGLLLICCCCLAAFFLGGPLFMGPEIGNVFSNIIEAIEMTPTP